MCPLVKRETWESPEISGSSTFFLQQKATLDPCGKPSKDNNNSKDGFFVNNLKGHVEIQIAPPYLDLSCPLAQMYLSCPLGGKAAVQRRKKKCPAVIDISKYPDRTARVPFCLVPFAVFEEAFSLHFTGCVFNVHMKLCIRCYVQALPELVCANNL